nr:transposase [Gloeotrichia echinulata DEX184]
MNERVFECGNCGLMIDRDLNAAINLSQAVS